MTTVLRRNFYSRSPVTVAKELIGKILVRRLEDGTPLQGIILETEAYGGKFDPASHAYRGMTPRNKVMFGKAGYAYVYFTYGFHHCLNFVTGSEGAASAVLIRVLEPLMGIEVMCAFRKTSTISNIASGPGKLCQALSIDRSFNGIDITSKRSPIHILDTTLRLEVNASTRIGIRKGTEKKWRFYAKSDSIAKPQIGRVDRE